jgi:hypothetical protein
LERLGGIEFLVCEIKDLVKFAVEVVEVLFHIAFVAVFLWEPADVLLDYLVVDPVFQASVLRGVLI